MSHSHTRTHTDTIQEQFYADCLAENYRQVEKWGLQDHDTGYWLGIFMEEAGEIAKAFIEAKPEQMRVEMIHAAAVLANWSASERGMTFVPPPTDEC